MTPLPKSHMFKMSHLKKKISLESYYSAADILKKLEELTGLVYLQDDNNPIIGFLPKNYLITQNNQNFLFTKTDLNKYKLSSYIENLLDFTQFQSQEIENSNR
ncbi:aminodeoxychorismate synthase component I, partial [Acinetobacter baumannii]|nr:aminodeoxychorismate synthase component I [Acinetobacter baumannii]